MFLEKGFYNSHFAGLSYWKLDENELYRPLPDNFESDSFILHQVQMSSAQVSLNKSFLKNASGLVFRNLRQDASVIFLASLFLCCTQTPDDSQLSVSLREIYHSKHRADPKGHEWDSVINSSNASPQVRATEKQNE